MHNISIFGTHSDSGKSTITFVVGRILQELGYSVVPFKAQNVSNNSNVADDGSEIAIAQYFQAHVLGVPTSYHLNPVLLKSGKGSKATLILEGKSTGDKDIWHYYQEVDNLQPIVERCFNYLNNKYDCIICEGAGSPVELNLMDKDLSNIFVAEKFNTKIILVADIEKGGVFASIYGVYNLLPEKLKNNVIGVIVNKFRGDMSLFDKGVDIIEKDFGLPVLGVLPYIPFNLGFEDSASLTNFVQNTKNKKLDVAVISYPRMSNYNDFEPLIADKEVNLEFVDSNVNLKRFDLVILPGSKLVLKDLEWLKETGIYSQLKSFNVPLYGLCGGYEMLFEKIIDVQAIESEDPIEVEGLSLIKGDITFQENKILANQKYDIFGLSIQGFEIHHGISIDHSLWFDGDLVKGSFVHGVFDDDAFRYFIFNAINKNYQGFNFETHKQKTINEFVEKMKNHIDVDRLVKGVC